MNSEEPKTESPAEPQGQPQTPQPEAKSTEQAPKRPLPMPLLIGVVAAIVLLAAAGLYWRYGRPSSTGTQSSTQATATPQPSPSPVDKAALLLQHFIKPTTGETWLAAAKKLTDQNYFANDDGSISYYQVGQHGTATIIISDELSVGENITLFERTPDGKVAAITHPDGEAVYSEAQDKAATAFYAAKVTINTTTHYDSLTMPEELSIGKGNVVKRPSYPNLGGLIVTIPNATNVDTTVGTFGASTVVRSETKYTDTQLTSIGYALLTPMHTRVTLSYDALESDLKGYQWARGATPTDTISPITRGCGGASTAVTRSDVLTAADVQTVGKSPSGIVIYELKSLDNPLMTKAYTEFNDFWQGSDKSSNQYIGISKADFAAQHAVIIMQDNYGQWLVFARDQLRPGAGCAKPVVYLYPRQSEQVSVKVGASVKVSDPFYNTATGWNVLAHPDGSISMAGKNYNSLFWEGPGIGSYPGITSGTVVPRSEVVATIRRQLAEQGLVGREIDDFMVYWQPHLPTTAYVRLTWFNTAQMNELAPLAISPRPDTLIRVFLDFDGLAAPITLPAQHLTAPARTGFTVVEWGGLANFPL